MGDISNIASLADKSFSGPIEFPGLGLVLNPPKTFFGTNIHWYGIIIAFGMVLAILLCMYLARRNSLSEENILDVVIWATPIGIICARIYYVVFSFDQYKDRLADIFKIWEGGIAIYGCVIGAIATVLVYCRIKKLSSLKLMDVCCIGLALGQSVGRWGNFVNREAFGSAVADTYILRMKLYTTPDMTTWATVHPTFLYESLWTFALFVLLLVIIRKKKFDGQVFWTYISFYGLGRFFIEALRTDSLYLGAFRVSQLVAVVATVTGVSMLIRGYKSQNKSKNIQNS